MQAAMHLMHLKRAWQESRHCCTRWMKQGWQECRQSCGSHALGKSEAGLADMQAVLLREPTQPVTQDQNAPCFTPSM